jgi:hypothetical protein
MTRPDTNPKSVFGAAKPGISAIPPVALLHCGRGMEDGERKYGLTNWRENSVAASVYYNAAFRHLASWWDGEQKAQDSGVHHLGHVMACCAILLDAEVQGVLIDDRPPVPGQFSRMVAEMTRKIEEAAKSDLCEDEGCPHHGTPHICVNSILPEGFEDRLMAAMGVPGRLLAADNSDEAPAAVAVGREFKSEEEFKSFVRDFLAYTMPGFSARRMYVFKWLDANNYDRVAEVAKGQWRELANHLNQYEAAD